MTAGMQLDVSKEIVAKAVLDSLTPEVREKLLAAAIKGLLSDGPEPRHYNGVKKTHLQILFEEQARVVASTIVREELQKPEHKAALVQVVQEAFQKLFLDPTRREQVVDKVAIAISEAWSKTERY